MNFEQAADVPAGSVLDTDVCVIGSGAAGITLARQLDGARLRVLVLEAGGLDSPGPDEDDSFAIEHLGLPFRNPLQTRGRWFGGSTNLWWGRMATFDSIDLEKRSWVPFSGWPLTYEELQPWVRKAAGILEVPDFEKIQLERWPSHPAVETFVRGGGANMGVFLWANALYMAPHHREAIRASQNVRLLLDATATELVPSEGSTAIESLEVSGPRGNRFTVKAATYVLAAGGLENPRLLLASTRRSPAGVGNAHDLVGRYYMDHPRGEALATVDLRPLKAVQLQWLTMLGQEAPSPFGGKVQLRITFPAGMQRDEQLLNHALHADFAAKIHGSQGYLGAKRLMARLRGQAPEGTDGVVSDLLATAKGIPDILEHGVQVLRKQPALEKMFIIDQMEQEPDPASRITVDRGRKDRFGLPRLQLDWRIGASTYRLQQRMHRMFKDILAKFNIHGFHSDVLDRPDERPVLREMKHPAGTTKMNASPSQGVVDVDGRVHGLANLYVSGSSTFPTVGHANPTLTIVALAARLAAHLRQRGAESSRR